MVLLTGLRIPPRRALWRTTAVALAAGGLSASLTGVSAAGAAGTTHRGGTVVVSTRNSPTFETIVVSGRPVYTLQATKTPCSARCLQFWPAVLLPKHAKHARAGSGVSASMLGIVKRIGGRLQVTYAGKPLYWFAGDTGTEGARGDVTDAWGTWSLLVLANPPGASSPTPPNAPVNPPATSTTEPGSTPPAATPAPPVSQTPVTPAPSPTQSPPSPPPPSTAPPTTAPTTTTTAPSSGGVSF